MANTPLDLDDYHWLLIADPSGDFSLGGLFRLVDIKRTAHFHFWSPSTQWKNIRSGKILTYKAGEICKS